MSAWGLEPMDIAKCWVPSLWCFARPSLQLSSVVCSWVFLFLVLSSVSDCRIFHFFAFKHPWVAYTLWSYQLCWIWLSLSRQSIPYTSEFTRLLLSSVTSSVHTNDPVPLEAIHAHAITLPPTWHALEHETFQAFHAIIQAQADLSFICWKSAVQNCFTCTENSFDHMLGVHKGNWHNLESNPTLLPA